MSYIYMRYQHSSHDWLDSPVHIQLPLHTYKKPNIPMRLLIDISPVKHKMTALEQKIFAQYLVSLKEFEYAHLALLSKNASVPEGLLDISVLQANLRLKEFSSEQTALDWLPSE